MRCVLMAIASLAIASCSAGSSDDGLAVTRLDASCVRIANATDIEADLGLWSVVSGGSRLQLPPDVKIPTGDSLVACVPGAERQADVVGVGSLCDGCPLELRDAAGDPVGHR